MLPPWVIVYGCNLPWMTLFKAELSRCRWLIPVGVCAPKLANFHDFISLFQNYFSTKDCHLFGLSELLSHWADPFLTQPGCQPMVSKALDQHPGGLCHSICGASAQLATAALRRVWQDVAPIKCVWKWGDENRWKPSTDGISIIGRRFTLMFNFVGVVAHAQLSFSHFFVILTIHKFVWVGWPVFSTPAYPHLEFNSVLQILYTLTIPWPINMEPK